MPNTNKSAPISTPLERIGAGGRDEKHSGHSQTDFSLMVCGLYHVAVFLGLSKSLSFIKITVFHQNHCLYHIFRRHWSALEQEGGTKSILGILKPTSASWCVAFITSLSSWVYQNHCLSSKSLSFIKITVFITSLTTFCVFWSEFSYTFGFVSCSQGGSNYAKHQQVSTHFDATGAHWSRREGRQLSASF